MVISRCALLCGDETSIWRHDLVTIRSATTDGTGLADARWAYEAPHLRGDFGRVTAPQIASFVADDRTRPAGGWGGDQWTEANTTPHLRLNLGPWPLPDNLLGTQERP